MNCLNLTPRETAQRLRIDHKTLANWRVQGRGPKFVKIGSKVVYRVADVEAFESGNVREHTARAA